MNELRIFDNSEFGQVRTLQIDGEPWFVGKDIAEALGYKNTRTALHNHVDNEDKTTVLIQDTPSGQQNMIIINESGLYSLILTSRKPNAKKFKRWVTSEVLPSIRKTGSYGTNDDLSGMKKDIAKLKEAVNSLKSCSVVRPRLRSEDEMLRKKKIRMRIRIMNYLIQKLTEMTSISNKTMLSYAYDRLYELGYSPSQIRIDWIDSHDGEDISTFEAICYDDEVFESMLNETVKAVMHSLY